MLDDDFAYADDEGIYLVKLARRSLETYLETGKKIDVPSDFPGKLKDQSGVFVTLRRHGVPHDSSLRGCIGMIEAREPLINGVINMALSSGLEDPRFPEVKKKELDNITFEVTAMTPPKLLEVEDPEDIPAKIKIGRDGIIMERGFRRGLLLPQVPVEQDPVWSPTEFLDYTCRKAWLSQGCWKSKETKVYTFQGEIFEEIEPRGDIKRKIITDS
ncbi:MAG: TIGR00296 family protein [Candidatus Hodarchaeota archaeon]